MTGQALVAADSSGVDTTGSENNTEFVTFNIAGQLFGIPVLIVQDILLPESIASIPLAPPEVRGSINLRGRIVTVVDVRVRLGLDRRAINAEDESRMLAASHKHDKADDDKTEEAQDTENAEDASEDSAEAETETIDAIEEIKRKKQDHMMAVTVEHHNELYTLLVDSVGDVIPLSKESYEGNPSTLDPLWREFAGGVYRLDGSLMVVLDVERLLDFKAVV